MRFLRATEKIGSKGYVTAECLEDAGWQTIANYFSDKLLRWASSENLFPFQKPSVHFSLPSFDSPNYGRGFLEVTVISRAVRVTPITEATC